MHHKKIYIAHWLPVEGEIQQGDFYMARNWATIFIKGNKIRFRKWKLHKQPTTALSKIVETLLPAHKIRVKLFLCTQQIQPGEEYMYFSYASDYVRSALYTSGPVPKNGFKKLHKISPQAKWVKEGDTFSQEEIVPWNDLLDLGAGKEHLMDAERGFISYIKIYNHSCEHFH